MLTKSLWLAVNILVVSALLLVSCGPRQITPAPGTVPTSAPVATPEVPRSIPASTPTPGPTPATGPGASVEKPKYGGTINILTPTDLEIFTPSVIPRANQLFNYVFELFVSADWSRGKAGTGEIDYGRGIPSFEYVNGSLAENWRTPEIGVWVLDIRKGVHFALDPNNEASRLANGREMTADDAAWSLQYVKDTPSSWINLSQPALAKNYTAEKTGPWQVTLRTPVDPGTGYCWITAGGGTQSVWAREVVEKYWKTNDWRNVVGTGPYMITDFIPGSVATFKKNPNYWGRDPVGPGKGNQLPYPDGIKLFVIVDLSTRLAAMRTGKADWVDAIQWEDAESLLKTNPKMQNYRYLGTTFVVAMRTDKQDQPYKDVRVRQALMMSTDFTALKDQFYGGQAEIYTIPVSQEAEHARPKFNELPEKVQALFKLNPEGAKKLLADAGYPNGFKARMIVQNVSSEMDPAAAIKAMWAKAGVDLELQPRDGAVYRSINAARSHEEMILRSAGSVSALASRYFFSGYRSASVNNPSYVNDPPGKDPVIEGLYQEIQKAIMINYPKADQLVSKMVPHIIEQSYYIPIPAPYSYRLWQPWLKNYYGEALTDSRAHFIQYVWIDQDLKEQVTGRR